MIGSAARSVPSKGAKIRCCDDRSISIDWWNLQFRSKCVFRCPSQFRSKCVLRLPPQIVSQSAYFGRLHSSGQSAYSGCLHRLCLKVRISVALTVPVKVRTPAASTDCVSKCVFRSPSQFRSKCVLRLPPQIVSQSAYFGRFHSSGQRRSVLQEGGGVLFFSAGRSPGIPAGGGRGSTSASPPLSRPPPDRMSGMPDPEAKSKRDA